MAVKTAKLTGAEAAVTGLDGSIAHIRNDGAGVVLASLKAGITEGADGVLSVPAGTSAALTGISGELHLLGIGSVVIVSNDYAECPFKSAVTLGSVTDEISRAAGGSNLLMNPDFRINQRGKSEYSTGYTVDRWYISTDKCKAAPESDGIRLTASVALASNTHAFWQNLEHRLGAYRSWVEQQFRAVQSHAARRLREPLIPAYPHAYLSEAGVPHFKSGVAGGEVELLLIEVVVRNMGLAVNAHHGAVGVYHCDAVVKHVAVLLVKANRKHHGKLLRHRLEALNSGVFLQRKG